MEFLGLRAGGDSEVVAQPGAQLLVDAQRLCSVAFDGERLHDKAVGALAIWLEAGQFAARADGSGKFGAADPEAGVRVRLGGTDVKGAEASSCLVDSHCVLSGKERSACNEHRHLGRPPRSVVVRRPRFRHIRASRRRRRARHDDGRLRHPTCDECRARRCELRKFSKARPAPPRRSDLVCADSRAAPTSDCSRSVRLVVSAGGDALGIQTNPDGTPHRRGNTSASDPCNPRRHDPLSRTLNCTSGDSPPPSSVPTLKEQTKTGPFAGPFMGAGGFEPPPSRV